MAALDRWLAVLVVAMAATGLLSLRAGAPSEGWIFTLHGVLAGALLAATAWKLRRSVPRAVGTRRWGRLVLGLAVSLITIAALTGGFLWVASGELLSVGSWTVLTLHAWVGLILVPILVIHLLPHRWRLLRPRLAPPRPGRLLSRRTLLAGGLLGMAGIASVLVTGGLDRWRGGERRFTGSRWLPRGGIPPATTFFGEGPPAIDPSSWRLDVEDGAGRRRRWSAAELASLGMVTRSAVLDCTSGWALETDWTGVPVARVVGPLAPGQQVLVRSATGWSTVLDADELEVAVLASAVAGSPLPVANGAPCRLVVPDRRGLDWVKWVTEVTVV